MDIEIVYVSMVTWKAVAVSAASKIEIIYDKCLQKDDT